MPLMWGFVMVLIKTKDLLNVYTKWYWNVCDWPTCAWRSGRTKTQPQHPEDRQRTLPHTCAVCKITLGHSCQQGVHVINVTIKQSLLLLVYPLALCSCRDVGMEGPFWRLNRVSWIRIILRLFQLPNVSDVWPLQTKLTYLSQSPVLEFMKDSSVISHQWEV